MPVAAGKVAGMRGLAESESSSGLKALVTEASHALALLDTGRLEELALSCEALNRNLALEDTDSAMRRDMAQQAHEARADMAVFGRVLDATRANLNVMKRLREMRAGELEYKAHGGACDWPDAPAEGMNGNR